MNNLYAIFDNLIEGIQVIDKDFRYLYLNKAIVLQSKAKREDLLGFTMMEKYPGIENTHVFQCIQNCINDKVSKRIFNEFKFPDGTLGFFELSIQPIEDGVLIMSVDVTEKNKVELELQKSLEQLQLSQELALIGSYEYDLLRGVIKWSSTTFKIMGWDEKDGEPKVEEVQRQVHPDDAEKMYRTLENAISTGRPYTNEYRIATPDGKIKHIRAIAKPIRDQTGQVTLIRGCVQDITSQKIIEMDHWQKEKDYRLLFEGIQESFIVHDLVMSDTGEILDLRFKELNPVTERMLGKLKADIIGRSRKEVLGPMDTEALEMVKKVVFKGEQVKYERYLPAVDRWFNVLIYSPQPGQIATLNLDITERKRAQEKLLKLNTELEEKVKERTQELIFALERERESNELKSKFVTTASHEFRTPLTTLLSSTFLIEEFIKSGKLDKTGKHLQRIRDSVRTLTAILEDFLSLEKLNRGKTQVRFDNFCIPSFAKEITDKLNSITKEGQQIIYEHSGPTNVTQDKKILENILLNLLSNAIKYSKEDIRFITSVEGDTLFIKIIDKGIGIPAEDQKNIFGMFFRASNVNNIQGTGLGLNIVKRYVDLLNGNISFATSPCGTTFTIQIPIADQMR